MQSLPFTNIIGVHQFPLGRHTQGFTVEACKSDGIQNSNVANEHLTYDFYQENWSLCPIWNQTLNRASGFPLHLDQLCQNVAIWRAEMRTGCFIDWNEGSHHKKSGLSVTHQQGCLTTAVGVSPIWASCFLLLLLFFFSLWAYNQTRCNLRSMLWWMFLPRSSLKISVECVTQWLGNDENSIPISSSEGLTTLRMDTEKYVHQWWINPMSAALKLQFDLIFRPIKPYIIRKPLIQP